MVKIYRRPWFVPLVLCLGAFLLYWPILNRTFAADDFLVMRRVGLEHIIFIKDFFRPLSDITLFFSYLLGGFNPFGYYVLSVLMHAASAFLLFRFCWLWKWTEDEGMQWRFAFLASLLFLCYPFHNECVAWGLGRASLSASLFGIGALAAVVSKRRLGLRIFYCCLCYFVGMAGYESVLLLPVMVFVVIWEPGAANGVNGDEFSGDDRGGRVSRRELLYWAAALGLTLALHIVCRITIAGTVSGNYGSTFLGQQVLKYGGNLFKLAGRLFLPPMNSSRAMSVLFVVVVVLLAVVLVRFFRVYAVRTVIGGRLLRWILLLVVTCAVPVLAGISSHTSESDRFIYFPSFFLCGGVALLLVTMVRRRVFLVAGLVVYSVIFLELNNWNWRKASDITKAVLALAGNPRPGGRVFLINVPDEVDGAFVFRLGLPDALVMEGKDSSRLVIVSHLTRDSSRVLPDRIDPEQQYPVPKGITRWKIAPSTTVDWKEGTHSFLIRGTGDPRSLDGRTDSVLSWTADSSDRIFFWNKQWLAEWLTKRDTTLENPR